MNIKSAAPARGTAPGGTQSIQRVVGLLRELVAVNRRGASAQQLAERAGLDRSTAHRMLQCLAAEGLLSFDADTHKYCFGPLAYDIGLAAAERLDLPQLCKPALARIAEDTGDTVFLMVRSGDDAVCADRAVGSYPIKTFVVDVGTRRPLGIGAGSLAILSGLPEDVAELVLGHNAGRIAAYPDMPMPRLRAMLEQSRSDGCVAMDVVAVPGARAVAVPVRAAGGNAVAALSVAAIVPRMTPAREAELIRLLHREAGELGEMLARRVAGTAG